MFISFAGHGRRVRLIRNRFIAQKDPMPLCGNDSVLQPCLKKPCPAAMLDSPVPCRYRELCSFWKSIAGPRDVFRRFGWNLL